MCTEEELRMMIGQQVLIVDYYALKDKNQEKYEEAKQELDVLNR